MPSRTSPASLLCRIAASRIFTATGPPSSSSALCAAARTPGPTQARRAVVRMPRESSTPLAVSSSTRAYFHPERARGDTFRAAATRPERGVFGNGPAASPRRCCRHTPPPAARRCSPSSRTTSSPTLPARAAARRHRRAHRLRAAVPRAGSHPAAWLQQQQRGERARGERGRRVGPRRSWPRRRRHRRGRADVALPPEQAPRACPARDRGGAHGERGSVTGVRDLAMASSPPTTFCTAAVAMSVSGHRQFAATPASAYSAAQPRVMDIHRQPVMHRHLKSWAFSRRNSSKVRAGLPVSRATASLCGLSSPVSYIWCRATSASASQPGSPAARNPSSTCRGGPAGN
jgi:hypothetical protein